MDPLDDYPLAREEPGPAGRIAGGRGRWFWGTAALLVLIGAAAAAYFATRSTDSPAAALAPDSAETRELPNDALSRRALGPEVEPRELPPLDLTDPIVRELVGALSSRPELAAWLASDGLIRNLAATVDAVARGATPSPLLRRLAPSRPFAAESRGDGFIIDTRSYQRYDGIADTVAALDANGVARVYAILRPRLREAYRELGHPEGDIDRAVEQAIQSLLDTPVLEHARITPAPVQYRYVDSKIERLSDAQKQLIRMGPRNQRLIQEKLRAVADELGI